MSTPSQTPEVGSPTGPSAGSEPASAAAAGPAGVAAEEAVAADADAAVERPSPPAAAEPPAAQTPAEPPAAQTPAEPPAAQTPAEPPAAGEESAATEPVAPQPGPQTAAEPAEPSAPATEPTATEPTATEPTATEPTATEPTATEPTATEPTAAVGPVEPLPPLAAGAEQFGRVASDGTVYVREGDGERAVGQFPDATQEEALAFFVRKYAELAAGVHLLEQRLASTSVTAKEARSNLRHLHEALVDPAAVGDLAALREAVARLDAVVTERAKVEEEQRAAARAAAIERRERIVSEAEQIAITPAEQLHFKTAGERMSALLDEWKTAQRNGVRLDKKTEDPLWRRFSAARSAVDRMRRQYFSEVAEQRAAQRAEKEGIIAEAEAMQHSTDWRRTTDAYRALMDRWKAAGRLGRKDDDALWTRFRAAQDVFFTARTAALKAQDEEYRGNLEVKEKLLAEAEALLPVTDTDSAKRSLRDIQERWDAAGRVPRSDLDRVEARLRAVIEAVREADSARWGKGNPDRVHRGSTLVSQLESQVAELTAKAEAAEARGDTKAATRARRERDTKRTWLEQARSSLSDLSR